MNNEPPNGCKPTQTVDQLTTPANQLKQGKKCPGSTSTEPLLTQYRTTDDTGSAAPVTKVASSKLRVSTTQGVSFPLFNELPVEIQRQIFEVAYRLSARYRRRNDWVFTCRKVREWIDPLIYEQITLSGGDPHRAQRRLQLYERTFRSKPQEFYSTHVRRIYTNNDLEYYSSDFELELLSVCDNITTLECWSDYREELRTILRTKRWPSLKTLSINIDLLLIDEDTFRLPIFQRVTHLEFTSKQPQLPIWKSLQYLEDLTHIRVFTLIEIQDFREAMDHTYATAVEARKYLPPNLKYFIIIVPENFIYLISNMKATTMEDRQRWDHMEDIRLGRFDARIVIGTCGNFEEYEELDLDQGGISSAMEYLTIVPALRYPNWHQDNLSNINQNTWKAVAWSIRERKKMQAWAKEV